MSFRLPQNFSAGAASDARHSALEAEVLAEKARALGLAGRRVETALEALRMADADSRERLLDAATDTVWGFLAQREICGFHDREQVIADYAIPREVLNRLGAVRPNV